MKCPNCGYENLPSMRFCGHCGTQLGQICHTCGFLNPPEHRFCGQCGTRLEETPPMARPHPSRAEPSVSAVAAPAEDRVAAVPLQLRGERRLATVILVDVADSTDLLERIGTEKWVQMMNQVLQTLEAEVYRFGGTVDQFRGDGLVAFFGAEAAHEDDPERAVLAGLAMHQAIEPMAIELAEQDGIGLRLRVGINTGEVIVASIGDTRHYTEDTAMGEAIALAARMETAAEPGTVLVSDNTYHLVESHFEWSALGRITVKGITEPLAVYRPHRHRLHAEPMSHWQPYDPYALLTGREAEFEALKQKVDQVRTGRGGIVFLIGETGMGKSALLHHTHQFAVRQESVLAEAEGAASAQGIDKTYSMTWLQGRGRSYDQSRPYSMWLDLFSGWLDVSAGEPGTEALSRLRTEVEALFGDQAAEEAEEHYPFLATFLSLPQEYALPEYAKYLDAGARRQKTFEAVGSWIEALARRGPLVLAFDNVHWADASSLELLEDCLGLCEELPLLWLIVFRPDRSTGVWGLRQRVETDLLHRVTTLPLFPLTDAQSEKMIDRLIGPDVLPSRTCGLVRTTAEGNPYYIEEFIHALIREGVLVKDAVTDRWRTTRTIDSLDLPSSLQNLLLARIDTLTQLQRRVLQMAAVIGSVFWSSLLETVACDGAQLTAPSLDASSIKDQLAGLQRVQLIQEVRKVPHLGTEYAFESNLIRDAAYDGLLSTQRVNWHRCVADTLERIFGEKVLPRYYSLLAHHYRRAGATRKELFYTVLAAEEAQEDRANVEALDYYNRALELLDGIEAKVDDESQIYAITTQRFEVLDGRRRVFFLMGDYDAGWADAKALLELARQLKDDPVWLIDALLHQPGVGFIGNKEDALKGAPMAEEALSLAQDLGDRRREMQSLAAVAAQRFFLHDPAWEEMSERALAMARELGDKQYEVGILTGLASTFAFTDETRSKHYVEAALPIVHEMDDKIAELDLLDVIGMQLETSGDYYKRLKECHEPQLALCREIGHPMAQARALMFVGQIQSLYLGDYEGGLASLEESRRLSEGNPFELFPLLRIAQVRLEQGKYVAAEAILERGGGINEGNIHEIGIAGLRLVLAMLYNARGDEKHLNAALRLTSEAIGLSAENPQLGDQYQMAAACESAAIHLRLAQIIVDDVERAKHASQGLKMSEIALGFFESSGFVRPIECVSEEILYRHSLALAENGREAESAEFLQRAHAAMMKKYELIPEDSHFRRTYLENIPLHREICAAFTAID